MSSGFLGSQSIYQSFKRSAKYFPLFFILSLTGFVYYRVLWARFVGDDFSSIVYCDFIKSWQNLPRLFDRSYISSLYDMNHWKGGSGSGEMTYRPLVTLSYMIDYSLGGLSPAGYHLTNLTLHLVNVAVVYTLSQVILRDPKAAFLASVFFALHPVNAESVGVISYRSDMISAFFFMIAFILHDRSRQGAVRWRWIAGSVVSYSFGLLSKESVIVLPFLLFLYDKFCGSDVQGPKSRAARWVVYAPYLFVAFIYICLWFYFKKGVAGSTTYYAGQEPLNYVLTCLVILADYVKLLAWPGGIHLTLPEPGDEIGSYGKPYVLGAFILIFLLIGVFFWSRKRSGTVSFCLAWSFVTILPFVPAMLLRPTRFIYLSALGFYWIAAILVTRIERGGGCLRSRMIKSAALCLAMIFIVKCIIIDKKRINAMRSQAMVVHELIRFYPRNLKALLLSATVELEQHRVERAIRQAKKAVEADPLCDKGYDLLGLAYYQKRMWSESIDAFLKVTRLSPGYAEPYLWAGAAYGQKGDHLKAIECFKKALLREPSNLGLYYNLGIAYLKLERIDDLRTTIAEAERIKGADHFAAERIRTLKQVLAMKEKSGSGPASDEQSIFSGSRGS